MKFTTHWMRGILLHRPERILGAAVGVALTIALLASLGSFLQQSGKTMTTRAIQDVPVDWQVQLRTPAADTQVRSQLEKLVQYQKLASVYSAEVIGFSASTGGSVQTTGSGKVLGLSSGYLAAFPRILRSLTGSSSGVLIEQQTAANLHVKAGDTVTVMRIGLPPIRLTVDGVVSFPYADSFFQAIGAPKGMAPQAPPDNVMILPENKWHTLFGPQATARPDTVTEQLHVSISHSLPTSPYAAYSAVTGIVHNFEARVTGSAIVADNLAARLLAVTADASYARILFLFLGLPGAILAMLLTIAVADSGREHMYREQALLRTRGASSATVLKYEALESVFVAGAGVLLGILITMLVGHIVRPGSPFAAGTAIKWLVVASLVGVMLAGAAVIYPAWKVSRGQTIVASRGLVRRQSKPLWRRIYLDMLFLALAGVVFWRTASSGYQVVLAPEGVPQISVHYSAFLAPFFLWVGGVFAAIRLWELFLGNGRKILSAVIHVRVGALSGAVAASLSRQRGLLTRGVIMVALATSFAVSTSVFNTSYNAQARVDAQLTNGADVTVSAPSQSNVQLPMSQIQKVPGVAATVPMMHRFAYVGNDLQDIFGIDPRSIANATSMSNAFFSNGDAHRTLELLAGQPNAVLVSEETKNDYQLKLGDTLKLRLLFPSDHQYHIVPFKFVGVVREFPTAPKDSFLIANASYLASQTGSGVQETILVRASPGARAKVVAGRIRPFVASLPGVQVTDLNSTQRLISSSLTSVDLHGLTTVELLFAILLVVGSTGLVLALGMNERRKGFAILQALGARRKQLGAFIWSEAVLVVCGGTIVGFLLGFGVSKVLVTVLKSVFDPPPEHLIVPWVYLGCLIAAVLASTIGAVLIIFRFANRSAVEELRA